MQNQNPVFVVQVYTMSKSLVADTRLTPVLAWVTHRSLGHSGPATKSSKLVLCVIGSRQGLKDNPIVSVDIQFSYSTAKSTGSHIHFQCGRPALLVPSYWLFVFAQYQPLSHFSLIIDTYLNVSTFYLPLILLEYEGGKQMFKNIKS